jgi:serine/threonine-protein kinase
MQLKPGDKLGDRYQLLSKLGEGGMGEVWKARDTELDRDVAVKVSKAEFTARFKQEARAMAAFSHNNICQIYDVGPNYIVMELIDGVQLSGPLPAEKAVAYAGQILDALDAAHRKGFTHRDLKPANVMVMKSGAIKLLDFGLAKRNVRELGPDDVTGAALTKEGNITGTLQYMSPEQLNGKEADARSDIFSFGCVLYEMLSGKKAFSGSTTASVIAAIMEREPEPLKTTPPLDRLIRTCLAKDPDERLQTARDLKRDLLWAMDDESPSSAPSRSRFGRTGWVVAGAAIVVAAGLGFGLYRATRPAELKPLVRLDVDLGADVSLGPTAGTDTILSPDGTRLVYVSQGKLFTRRMDQPKAVELAGTEGAYAPFFSPDGKWVAFFATGMGKLEKISVEGGAAVALCDAPAARGGSWGEDGNIIAALASTGSALSRIPSTGGAPTPVTQLAQGETTHRWPQILPGGKAVLFTSHTTTSGFDGANIEVVSLADHRRKTLERGGTFGRYLPASSGTGHLVYINKGTLYAVPFDPDKLELHGTPSPVLEDVAYIAVNGSAQLDFSSNGTLVYRSGGVTGGDLVTVQWLDATGKTQPLVAKPGSYQRPRVSPDGQRLALDDRSDIWVYEARRDTMTRLTFGGGANNLPVWSPDGRYIAFRGPGGGIWWVRSDGAGKPQQLIQGKNTLGPTSFTPDGKRLAYTEQNPRTSYDIWTVPIESDGAGLRAGKPESFLQTPADERHPAFSPDSHWLAYSSNESGPYQVYVRAFPDKGGKWQISNTGGMYPVWSGNGHELFFRTEDNRIMVATYAAKEDSFVPDKARVWSDKQLANLGPIGVNNYDLAPDGKRIAALMSVESLEARQAQSHVIFLENFGDELQRKAPDRK